MGEVQAAQGYRNRNLLVLTVKIMDCFFVNNVLHLSSQKLPHAQVGWDARASRYIDILPFTKADRLG